ncbi:MAG: acyl-CoA thioesterase [Candidatus Eisenbacteria bacterium]|nr:acyl-CoA thioesterase [Candidatus Eisenbacteria bacterium]
MHRFALRVRYADTDRMGWAYYGNYFRWFEIGRAEMLRSLGRSYLSIEDDLGLRLPVREARCRYLRGARYDDALVIETGVADRSRAGVEFAYRVMPEAGGTPHALGRTAHFFMDGDGRPVRVPHELDELLARAPIAPAELLAQIGSV